MDVELLMREVQKGDGCEGVVAKSSTEILLGNIDWTDPIDVFISAHKYSEDIWG